MRVSSRTLLGAAIAVGAAALSPHAANAASSNGAEVHHYGGCTSETSCWQEHVAFNAVTTASGVQVNAGGGTVMYETTTGTGTWVSRSAGGVAEVTNPASGQYVLSDHNFTMTQYRAGADSWGCHTLQYWHIANGEEQQPREFKGVCH